MDILKTNCHISNSFANTLYAYEYFPATNSINVDRISMLQFIILLLQRKSSDPNLMCVVIVKQTCIFNCDSIWIVFNYHYYIFFYIGHFDVIDHRALD